MVDSSLWMIVPGNAGLSALILFVIAMPFLYAARDGSRVSHGSLDEHARELMRVLIQDGKAKP